jgi:hypothetical protein
MFDFFKKRGNVLVTPKEKEIEEITKRLRAFPVYDRHEIVTGILCRVFPEPLHLHKNPQRKQAA